MTRKCHVQFLGENEGVIPLTYPTAYVNGNPVSLTDPFGLSPELTPSNVVHGILDIISMFDPFGVADGINGVIYFFEKDYFRAGISFACVLIPFAFDAGAKTVKWGSKGFKATKAGQKLVAKTAKYYDFAKPVANTISNTICGLRTTGVGKVITSRYATDAIVGATFSMAAQKIITGEVDWSLVAKNAAISVVSGKINRTLRGQSDFSGGFCFTEDTLILAKSGSKLIKDIKIGDEVYSANPDTGEKGLKKVTNVFVNETDVLIHVFAGNEEIRTTPTHPFWVEGKGWIDAAYLVQGDRLRTYKGELIEVEKVEVEYLDEFIKVYNFEVEDWHTYFVSDTELLVHNMCDPKPGVGSKGKVNLKLDELHTKLDGLAESHLLPQFREIDPNLKAGYTGSFKTGTVGNPKKPTYGQPINLNKYDIDYWIESDVLYEMYGNSLKANPKFREILANTPGFEGLKPNKEGFSIKFKPRNK